MNSQTIIISLSILVLFNNCHRKTVPASHRQLNQVVIDPKGNPNLMGLSTEEGLYQPPFHTWYTTNYHEYTPDSATLIALRPALRGKTFRLFMATWCGDSKRDVPRIYKIFAACGVPPTSIELINVSNADSFYKQSPTHEERGLNVHHVPTLIVYEKGKEINRIVESPIQTLEQDLLEIVQQNRYVPKYPTADWLARWYQQPDWQQYQKDSVALAVQLKTTLLHQGELDGLGRIQLAGGETDKALFTLQLNNRLYPSFPVTNRSYAKALLRKGDTALARIYMEKAEALAGQ